MPERIVLIRHAEEPHPAGPLGVDEQGRPDGQSLSVRGWQRAGALAALFSGRACQRRDGAIAAGGDPAPFSRPTALFAASDPGKSRRPLDTLRPLADVLRLPVHALPSEMPAQTAAQRMLGFDGSLLVCWRHRTLAALLHALAGGRAGCELPSAWDEARYDLVWCLWRAPDASGPWRFRRMGQRLLAGDGEAGDGEGGR